MAWRGFCWKRVMASVKFFTRSVRITGRVLWQQGLPPQNGGNWSIFMVASLWKGIDLRGYRQQLTWRCYGTPTRHEGLSIYLSIYLSLYLSLSLSLPLSCAFPLLFLLCFPSSTSFCCAFPLLSVSVVLSFFFLFLSYFLSSFLFCFWTVTNQCLWSQYALKPWTLSAWSRIPVHSSP